MARGFLSTVNKIAREAEKSARRAQQEAERREREAARNEAQLVREMERARQQEVRAQEAERKRQISEAKAAHVEARNAEVEELNAELAQKCDAIDGILAATLEIDDYFDLTSLRRAPEVVPFKHSELEQPSPRPPAISDPVEPVYVEPPPPKALFGKEKKHKAAIAEAQEAHELAQREWQRELKQAQARRIAENQEYEKTEKTRLEKLASAKAAHAKACAQKEQEVAEYNDGIERLIADLGYGSTDAVEAYFSIVFARSIFPDHFPVSHESTFEPSSAELRVRVSIPPPSDMVTIKNYRYVKKDDEIAVTNLSQKACKDRYASAIDQVALRSIHEVFEADRRGLVKTVSVEVGTQAADPATGIESFIPLAAVAAERENFLQFDLSAVVPRVTMEHLGGVFSKKPYDLIAVDTSGVRKA
jgi:restriction system protein